MDNYDNTYDFLDNEYIEENEQYMPEDNQFADDGFEQMILDAVDQLGLVVEQTPSSAPSNEQTNATIVQTAESVASADVPSQPNFDESPLSPSNDSSECWSAVEHASNEDDLSEALQSERINSFVPIKLGMPVKQEPISPATNSVILMEYYKACTEYLYLVPSTDKLHISKPVPRCAAQKAKPKKKSNGPKAPAGSRVTMAMGFEREVPESSDGKRYIMKCEAEAVAMRVKQHQFKISDAGRKLDANSVDKRSAYTKLHDALNKAGWKREIIGDFYVYSTKRSDL